MNTDQSNLTAKRMLNILNTVLLLIHSVLLLVFTALQVTLMARVNIVGVSCYLLS